MSRRLFETPTGSHKVTQCPLMFLLLGKHVVVHVIMLCFKRQLWFQNMISDYVRKYFDVKKRAFFFDHFYAKFLFVNHPRNYRCEIRAFALKIMCVFPI